MASSPKRISFTGFILWTVILLLGVGLFLTNPDQERFNAHVQQLIIKEARDYGGAIGLLVEAISGAGAFGVARYTTRNNYFFFSIYTVEIMDEQQRFLGIANYFYEI